ncbi:MAG: hypothetical protein GYA23_09375 [Methanomicrobiales archaeon]|nr:hypothetical protein [Methanomicrobiales archaeon]
MTETIVKGNCSPLPGWSNDGSEAAASVSTPEQKTVSAGAFQRAGSIGMQREALRISYESFNKSHVVYIGRGDLTRFVQNPLAGPAPVYETTINPDGSELYQKIGHAHQSMSGRALMICTSTSAGELTVPWSMFMAVINGRRGSSTISRVHDRPRQQHPVAVQRPVPASDNLRSGLEGGF